MHRARGSCESPAGPSGSGSRPNRLRRSSRSGPQSQMSDFKTPTRIQRPRSGAVFSQESPHNDSDVQQDIIWDATSPSPNRRGKRGKTTSAGVVNISDIVSRIAPKHGRPQAAEPTLQQWIGDSATIPCTPDIQAPKHKKKSPRSSGVDDLLKLAKQFDFNMFHQKEAQQQQEEEEEKEEEVQPPSPDLLSDDDLFAPHDSSSRRPGSRLPETGPDSRDQFTGDDLDSLFDGPTQHVSGNLSQALSSAPASSSSFGPATVSTMTSKAAPVTNDFEDDWENDDLLNDSLVMEMTQNPLKFTAPQLCSTQRPGSGQSGGGPRPKESPVRSPLIGQNQPAVFKVEKEDKRLRSTFKLESGPQFSIRRTQTDTWTSSEAQPTKCNPSPGFPVQQNWQQPKPVNPEPQKPQISLRADVTPAPASQRFPQKPDKVSTHSEVLDDDLLRFFSSDPVWDDPADDDLLCELCEDLENQIQNGVSMRPSGPLGQGSAKRSVLQPGNATRVYGNQQAPATSLQTVPQRQPAGGPAGSSLAGSFRFTQTRNTTNISPSLQGNTPRDQFTFKRPLNLVSTATSRGPGKCSAAEIQRKKQEAVERRRQRQQAAHNLRAPT